MTPISTATFVTIMKKSTKIDLKNCLIGSQDDIATLPIDCAVENVIMNKVRIHCGLQGPQLKIKQFNLKGVTLEATQDGTLFIDPSSFTQLKLSKCDEVLIDIVKGKAKEMASMQNLSISGLQFDEMRQLLPPHQLDNLAFSYYKNDDIKLTDILRNDLTRRSARTVLSNRCERSKLIIDADIRGLEKLMEVPSAVVEWKTESQ